MAKAKISISNRRAIGQPEKRLEAKSAQYELEEMYKSTGQTEKYTESVNSRIKKGIAYSDGETHADALMESANLAIQKKNYSQSVKFCLEAIADYHKAGPRHRFKASEYLVTLAQCYELNNQLTEAEETYKRALVLWPDSVPASGVPKMMASKEYAELLRKEHKDQEAENIMTEAKATLEKQKVHGQFLGYTWGVGDVVSDW